MIMKKPEIVSRRRIRKLTIRHWSAFLRSFEA